ncbi:hypothetical protein CFC21_022166 [Triticum aestivum]|uniref:Uncharacterized protein n=2 Tax=Triticum aestivum TaxID=4565 RepID=A0A3B6C1T5_WHEAT|nr:hypothetical protein CFC21_022166 [Triticum aestivum]
MTIEMVSYMKKKYKTCGPTHQRVTCPVYIYTIQGQNCQLHDDHPQEKMGIRSPLLPSQNSSSSPESRVTNLFSDPRASMIRRVSSSICLPLSSTSASSQSNRSTGHGGSFLDRGGCGGSLLDRGGGGGLVEVVGFPEVVDGARLPGVEPQPRLPLPAPVQQADGARVEAPAPPLRVVPAEPVLVPPVVHRHDLAGEHQQERRQRPQAVDPLLLLLDRHPLLHPPRVAPRAPPRHVDHHHARVEVARPAPPVRALPERGAEPRVRPEGVGEVLGEVGVAVLGRRHHVAAAGVEVHGPELPDVVDDHHVGVEVDDPAHGAGQRVGEVDASVVERLVQRVAHGAGDAAADAGRVEEVHAGVQVREGGAHGVGVPPPRRQEVEGHVLRARRVLQDGEDGGDGAAEVVGVQRHGDVHALPRPPRRAPVAVPERRRLPEPRPRRRQPCSVRRRPGARHHRHAVGCHQHRGQKRPRRRHRAFFSRTRARRGERGDKGCTPARTGRVAS